MADGGPLRASIEISGFSQDECERAWQRYRERALEDHDDVEAVYANFDIPEEILEAVGA